VLAPLRFRAFLGESVAFYKYKQIIISDLLYRVSRRFAAFRGKGNSKRAHEKGPRKKMASAPPPPPPTHHGGTSGFVPPRSLDICHLLHKKVFLGHTFWWCFWISHAETHKITQETQLPKKTWDFSRFFVRAKHFRHVFW
jgi:hypothetical protein